MPRTVTTTSAPTPEYPSWITEAIANLPPLCTVHETAALLRLSARTIARYLSAGTLVGVQRPDKDQARVLIPRSEIARYLAGLATRRAS